MRRLALAALLLAACTPFAPVPDTPDEEPVEPPSAVPRAVVAPPPEAPSAPLPPGFEALGQACPEQREEPMRVVYECNGGRVAGALQMVNTFGSPGPSAEQRLPPMPAGTVTIKGMLDTPVHVFVDGAAERVWVSGECPICRTPIQELRIVSLPLASNAQLGSLQAMLGIPQEPALRTAAAWREALERRRAKG